MTNQLVNTKIRLAEKNGTSEKMTPVEMYNDLVQKGYVVPANIEPSAFYAPTAYISVPSVISIFTPPVSDPIVKKKERGYLRKACKWIIEGVARPLWQRLMRRFF